MLVSVQTLTVVHHHHRCGSCVARLVLSLLLLFTATGTITTTSAQQVTGTCETGKVKLEVEVKTDMFPEETSLTLVNACDQTNLLTIQQGTLENMSETKQYSWCIEDPSAYTITVTDKLADGFMGDGYVQVKYAGKTVFNSGKFFKSTDRTFGYCAGQPMPSAAPSKSAEPSMVPSVPPTKMPTFPIPDSVKCQAGEQRFVLDLKTDIFAEELSFELKNICNGNTLVKAKPNTLRPTTPYKITQCVSPGDGYTFNISDASGDGLYGDAFYSLKVGDQLLVAATPKIGVATITSFGRCTAAPSAAPSASKSPSLVPTSKAQPTKTIHPSAMPSPHPSAVPSLHPSSEPSLDPSSKPSHEPSDEPSHKPTPHPTPRPTKAPTVTPPTDPNANCPCNGITNTILHNICRRLYPKRCPAK